MLNIYLVLGTQTTMKSNVFISMVDFLCKHNQLEAVMIKQVQDIAKLSEDWKLSREQRYELYVVCAKALEHANDSSGAFQVYMEAARHMDIGGKNKKDVDATKK